MNKQHSVRPLTAEQSRRLLIGLPVEWAIDSDVHQIPRTRWWAAFRLSTLRVDARGDSRREVTTRPL